MLKILTYILLFFIFSWNVSAFLWDDLGLDMYREIDEWLEQLERLQYQYELGGQWRGNAVETIGEMLRERWIECEPIWIEGIETMLWNTSESPVSAIFNACSRNWEDLPYVVVEQVQNELWYIKNTYQERAREKSQRMYELSRVWLYSDGSLDNSPFDLMYDLEEIDRLVFSEDVSFQDIPVSQNTDEALEDFTNGITNVLDTQPREFIQDTITDVNENTEENSEITPWDEETEQWDITLIPEILTGINEHEYFCAPDNDNEHGLNQWTYNQIISRLADTQRYYGNSLIDTTTGEVIDNTQNFYQSNGTQNSSPIVWSTGSYSWVSDSFPCDSIFCIEVSTQSSQYWVQWSNEISLQSIFSKVAEHLEKPANASLTQRKMTTNNFEISSIIEDLPGMLRGFGIQVQTKPIPILDIDEESEEDEEKWDIYSSTNMLHEYYKNLWLDYSRQNDISAITRSDLETKVFQSSAWMSIVYPESRMNELRAFEFALQENNRVFSKSIEKDILNQELTAFDIHFAELERFVSSIEDFSVSVWSLIDAMKKIPTRSS